LTSIKLNSNSIETEGITKKITRLKSLQKLSLENNKLVIFFSKKSRKMRLIVQLGITSCICL